ncbi:MAG: DUF2956 domain-containing protein [Colwellia sp.]
MNKNISKEVQEQAMKIAKGTQKKGQTKEQTKLIALGIEKGIAEYKKQQSVKRREQDKKRKQQVKLKTKQTVPAQEMQSTGKLSKLPWILLVVSWAGFIMVKLSF